tara:strand:+ start:230 stop:970 length:741 start_codon:yes stop_codon:yes gene_type:complete
MIKRLFDLLLSFLGLSLLMPLLLIVLFIVWVQDFHNPFYVAPRVGINGKTFKMIKIRSMIIGADSTGVDSTKSDDQRITLIGKFIRKFKIDEVSQLLNVLFGSMSLVGPRPNVKRETDLYTDLEKKLLSIKPGITDIASIVFSDEADILMGTEDPDIAYNQLIRPGKGELGVFYIDKRNLLFDIKIILITVISIISRKKALKLIASLVDKYSGSEDLTQLCLRESELVPKPPYGSDKLVTSREMIN